jgi:hypothetical protein
MRQSVRIDRNMALNSRDFFARIIPFLFGRVGVFDTLGIDNNETRFRFPAILKAYFFD